MRQSYYKINEKNRELKIRPKKKFVSGNLISENMMRAGGYFLSEVLKRGTVIIKDMPCACCS